MTETTGDVEITLLGGFEVAVAGKTLPDGMWPGRRSVELVQLLALAERRQVLRERVLDALWPHLDPDAGAANLRKAAHHARQALGDPDAVVLRGGAVALFPTRTVTTDLERFVRAATDALASGAPDACAGAADRYGGDLLPGSLYEEWTQQARTHARTLQVDLLRTAGRWAEVVTLEPTDEGAYQELMRQAIATGARAAAIRWYGQLRTTLARELGVAPDEVSRRLYDQCVDELAEPGGELVGRTVELATVSSLLGDGGRRRGGALAVRGPAGIGKSTLCRELTRVAEAAGWSVRTTTGQGRGHAYAPLARLIDEILVDGVDVLVSVGGHPRSVLATLSPAAAPAAPLEGPLSRHQVIGAVHRLLRAAGGGRPVAVVLDDAHLSDDATLEALSHLAASTPDVLVVLAYRDAPGSPAVDRAAGLLTRAGRMTVIDLLPLAPADAEALVAACAPRPLPTRTVSLIVSRAEGNPFVTAELARAADPARPDELPPGVAEAVTTRLVDLDADAVAILQRMALAGSELDSGVVVALTGGNEELSFSVLDRALEAGVLIVAGGRYRFRHDLVRQVLVDAVPPHQRLAVHRDAARRLADCGASPATVARHWLAGERPDEAVDWLLAAAGDAMALGAFADARSHLDAVLAHDRSHARALRLRAEALDMMGDPGALAAYDAAIAAAGVVDAQDLVAMRALAQLKQGDPPGALAAIAGASPTSVMGRLSEALTYAGAAALGFADPAFGTAKAAESRRLALQSGDTAAIVVASWAQAAAAHARGELHDSVLADLRDTKDLPHLAVRVFDGHLCITQRFLYGSRPYPDVIAFADALADEGARLGAARGHAFGVTLRGEAELLSGRLDDAEADLIEGGRLHRRIAGATGEALALQRLAELALARGLRDKAAAALAEALDLARVTDIGFHLLDRIYGTRIVLARSPDEALAAVDEAEAAVQGPLETCPGCRITFAVPAAVACARAGDLDRALAYEKDTEYLAQVVMRLPAWNAAYEEVRGHVALAGGDIDIARERFAAAAELFAAAGHPLDRDRCAQLASPHRPSGSPSQR